MFFAKSSTPSPSLCDASIGNFFAILSEAKDLSVKFTGFLITDF
jgi:hypothetical protein